jgi:AcrR family transcriptional regulator
MQDLNQIRSIPIAVREFPAGLCQKTPALKSDATQSSGLDAQGAKMPLQVKNSTQKEKIVAAASQLFARQGYHGTSTREIARLADVSENTIFRHFDRKEDLFWSALRSRCSAIRLRRDMADGMIEGDAPEVILPKIIEFLADILNYSPELLRLIAVALLEMQWKADVFCDECLSPSFSAISKYLAMNVQKGKVRNLDPTMVTAALTTMVLVHPWFSRHTSSEKTIYADSRAAERAYTSFWLDVLAPRSATNAREAGRLASGIAR